MKPRIYIDTSVVGGFFDEEFEDDTKKFSVVNKAATDHAGHSDPK